MAKINSAKLLSLTIAQNEDLDKAAKICHALSSHERLQILQFLQHKSRSLTEISKALDIPFSSVVRHKDILLDTQIIQVHSQPSLKGHSIYCSLNLLNLEINFEEPATKGIGQSEFFIEMPIGMFAHCDISAPCGMLSKDGPIGEFDIAESFLFPERSKAECLWFDFGQITYLFPAPLRTNQSYSEISFSFELCSEAPYYNNDWPSDITISINNTELPTFTLPGDFGGQRGRFTPQFWPITSTQFGLLKTITINERGVYFDGSLVSKTITFNTLNLFANNSIEFSLAIKEDAVHRGGVNLFGANFGNHPQHIVMILR